MKITLEKGGGGGEDEFMAEIQELEKGGKRWIHGWNLGWHPKKEEQ